MAWHDADVRTDSTAHIRYLFLAYAVSYDFRISGIGWLKKPDCRRRRLVDLERIVAEPPSPVDWLEKVARAFGLRNCRQQLRRGRIFERTESIQFTADNLTSDCNTLRIG